MKDDWKRNHMLHEHQVLLQTGERKRVREKPDAVHCSLAFWTCCVLFFLKTVTGEVEACPLIEKTQRTRSKQQEEHEARTKGKQRRAHTTTTSSKILEMAGRNPRSKT